MNYGVIIACVVVLIIGLLVGVATKKNVVIIPCAILITVIGGVFAYQISGSILRVAIFFGVIALVGIIITLLFKFIFKENGIF